MATHLFEAAESTGIRREQLAAPLRIDPASLVDPKRGLEWDTLVALLEQLSALVGHDVERLRDVGRAMAMAPSFATLQAIARVVLSLKSVYLAGERWISPANVPHVVQRTTFPAPDRMHFSCAIPEPYAASAPYLHIFEGLLVAVPSIMGLPPAKVESSSVTPRTLDMMLVLPRSRSVVGMVERAARAALRRADVLELLEGERRSMAVNLEAAQRATEEIVTLFSRLPDVVVIHRGGAIVWLNRAAVRTLGYDDAGDLVGRPLATLFHPSSQAFAQERIDGEASGAGAPDLVDAQLLARDGRRVLVEVSPSQSVSFGGKEARLLCAHDVTERKRLQRELSIADRLASFGMLAAGVAHEVNNPLAYVLNNIEIARRELGPLGPDADGSRAALEVALEGVGRIRTIVHDLLVLTRVEAAPVGAVDPCSVVRSTLSLAAPQIAERAELVCELGETPPVVGTSARIGQVLLNLVANALEAMAPDRRPSNVLRVAVRRTPSGGAEIAVTDTGVGIAPEHADHVFEPFFTTKIPGEGTGLGLAISQRLVAELGGELSFESVPGRTTFRVTLRPADSGDGAPT